MKPYSIELFTPKNGDITNIAKILDKLNCQYMMDKDFIGWSLPKFISVTRGKDCDELVHLDVLKRIRQHGFKAVSHVTLAHFTDTTISRLKEVDCTSILCLTGDLEPSWYAKELGLANSTMLIKHIKSIDKSIECFGTIYPCGHKTDLVNSGEEFTAHQESIIEDTQSRIVAGKLAAGVMTVISQLTISPVSHNFCRKVAALRGKYVAGFAQVKTTEGFFKFMEMCQLPALFTNEVQYLDMLKKISKMEDEASILANLNKLFVEYLKNHPYISGIHYFSLNNPDTVDDLLKLHFA